MNRKVAIVTGGSSGIGRCTAETLLNKGCIVYSISRRVECSNGVFHITADVTDEASVSAAIWAVMEREGRIDILVNCAGSGISGAVEFTELSDAKFQMDVNFFGTVNACKAVLPIMRTCGSGRIVNISSVAAVADIPFQTYYSASKAAINSYTCALANEVKPFGITVTAVMPGDIKTGFTDARRKSDAGNDVYGGRISRSVAVMEKDEKNGMSPKLAGAYICNIALKRDVKPLYAIGFGYKFLCVLCKILPCRLRNYIVGMLYAK